jgi:hypothetical protein
LKHKLILRYNIEKCATSLFSCDETIKSNNRIFSMKEIDYIQYKKDDEDEKANIGDLLILNSDHYVAYFII